MARVAHSDEILMKRMRATVPTDSKRDAADVLCSGRGRRLGARAERLKRGTWIVSREDGRSGHQEVCPGLSTDRHRLLLHAAVHLEPDVVGQHLAQAPELGLGGRDELL